MAPAHALHLAVPVAWARVEPRRGAYAEAELDTLGAKLRQLRASGTEPTVVLHAGALPDWVLARRGWLDPTVLADWGCFVDRVAQRVGVHVRRWATFRDPFGEAAWYDGEVRHVLRTLLDAHATAWLHLARTQGTGGKRPDVGVIVRLGAEAPPVGLRQRAARALREAYGEEAWLRVLATGRVSPPFGAFGELPNGTPALDWIGAEWAGAGTEGDSARATAHARLCTFGKPVYGLGGASGPS